MRLEANRKVRSVYCLTLLQATIIPFTWGVFMNMTAALQLPLEQADYIARTAFCLVFLASFGYRLYTVIRNPEALAFFSSGTVTTPIRSFSIVLMWIGALAIPSVVVGLAILLTLGAGLIAPFLMPIWLATAIGIGFAGVIVFEVTRWITIRSS